MSQGPCRSFVRGLTTVTRQVPLACLRLRAERGGTSGEDGSHLGVCWKPAGRFLREAEPTVHGDLEDAAAALAESDRSPRRLRQNHVPRRTGARLVASHAAIFDFDLHLRVPCCRMRASIADRRQSAPPDFAALEIWRRSLPGSTVTVAVRPEIRSMPAGTEFDRDAHGDALRQAYPAEGRIDVRQQIRALGALAIGDAAGDTLDVAMDSPALTHQPHGDEVSYMDARQLRLLEIAVHIERIRVRPGPARPGLRSRSRRGGARDW